MKDTDNDTDLNTRRLVLLDPMEVVVIGLDTKDGAKHPRYDVRAHNSFNEDIVLGMMQYGVKKPISVVKNGDNLEVVDGRQRVINAREANRRLAKAGSPLLRIPVLPPERGTDAKMFALTVLLNEHRVDDSPFGRGQKAQMAFDMGYTEAEVATLFRVSPATIHNYMSLLDLVPEIQKMVIDGTCPSSKGYELAAKGQKAQAAYLHRLKHGNRSGQHKTRAPSKKVLTKIAESGSTLPEGFRLGIRFALGQVKVEDVKGLAKILDKAPEPETPKAPAKGETLRLVPKTAPVKSKTQTVMVDGKPQTVPVKVYLPGEKPDSHVTHVNGFGSTDGLSAFR